MLALGAGIYGVRVQMEYLQKILAKAMKMTNCNNLMYINSAILY